jgi:hypothetical protein
VWSVLHSSFAKEIDSTANVQHTGKTAVFHSCEKKKAELNKRLWETITNTGDCSDWVKIINNINK